MERHLDEKLTNTFPSIFRGKDKPITVSLIAFGLECGNGWYDLLNDLCIRLQDYCDKHPEVTPIEATQVKEKFGGLRFYVNGGDAITEAMIDNAEKASYTICEICGSTVGVHQTEGWIKTLCSKCDTKTS